MTQRSEDLAKRLARALLGTTQRHLAGCMGYGTWKSHMASLWGQAEAAGVADLVREMVDIRGQAREGSDGHGRTQS